MPARSASASRRTARCRSNPRPLSRTWSESSKTAPPRRERSAEKEPVRRILALVDPWISHGLQEAPELRHLRAWDLHADQHAAIVGPVVAVVEEADVPVRAHPREEAQQRARALGKFEAVDQLVAGERRVSAHQAAHVRLRQFAVSEIAPR